MFCDYDLLCLLCISHIFIFPESVEYGYIFRCTLWTVLKTNTTALQNIVLFYHNNYYVLELTVRELLNGADLIGMDFVLFCFYRRSVYSFFSAGVRRGLSVVWTKQGFRAANSWYGEIYSVTSHVGTCEEVEFLPYVICDFCAVPAFSIKACCGILSRGCWRPCTALFSCQHPVRVLY